MCFVIALFVKHDLFTIKSRISEKRTKSTKQKEKRNKSEEKRPSEKLFVYKRNEK